MPRAALVGRRHEHSVLRDLVDRAAAGTGGAVLVLGEAGIGKSALVAAAATAARASGMQVVTGICWQGAGAPGYWPWVQVLRELADETGALGSAQHLDGLPGLGSLLGGMAQPSRSEAAGPTSARVDEAATFALHDAVTRVIVRAARATPVTVVLEDLQWADTASLRIAEMLVARAALEPIAVLATHRDEGDPATRARIGAAFQRAVTVRLTGLASEDVAELVTRTTGIRPQPDLLDTITAGTGGNPFFVQQTAALWRSGGATRAIPPGVGEALARRLARLPSSVHDLLLACAVWGRTFDVEAAAATADIDTESADDLLGVAREAGLVLPVEGRGLQAAFVHDLLRESLLVDLSPDRAQALHARAVRSLDDVPHVAARILPTQLAEHAHLAGPMLPVEQAAPLLIAAARAEAARLALDEATLHYERAVALLAQAGPSFAAEHAQAALAWGTVQGRAGHVHEARCTFEDLASLARATGDTVLLARAALGLHELGHDLDSGPDGPMDFVLDAVQADAQIRGTALAARVMAAASRDRAHLIGGDRRRAEELSEHALRTARGAGDLSAVALCLVARHDAIWAPGSVRERLSLATELASLGQRLGDPEAELLGSHLRVVALLELGDPRGLSEHDAAYARARSLLLPRARFASMHRQAAIDTLQGRFAEARRGLEAAHDLGERIGEPNTRGVWVDQLWQLQRLTGDAAQLEALRAELDASTAPQAAILEATLELGQGRGPAAVQRLDDLSALAAQWPRWATLAWLAMKAEMALAVSDRVLAEQTRAGLQPWLGQWVVLGGLVRIGGPASYYAALADAAHGDWDRAVAGFGTAIAAAERLSAEPWSLLGRLQLAVALLQRGHPDDLTTAAALSGEALPAAERLRMRPASALAERIRAQLSQPPQAPERGPRAGLNAIRLEGAVWTLEYRGRVTRLPDSKGLRDLRALLTRPGEEIAAADLVDPTGSRQRRALDALGSDPVLDDTAKRAFRQRVIALDEEIEDAELLGDDDRAATADRERQTLLAELARAIGLGGRPRRLGDRSERARKAVSGRIRDAIRHVGEQDPQLATHLAQSVHTGTTCSYRPTSDVRWR